MSIEKKIEENVSIANHRRIEISKLTEYLNSDKVQLLISKYLESNIGTLIERGDQIRLYLTKDKLEVYEYEMIEISKAKIDFPILNKIFYRMEESKVIKSYTSFVARLNGDHSFTVNKLNVCFSADKLISLLDELLFD